MSENFNNDKFYIYSLVIAFRLRLIEQYDLNAYIKRQVVINSQSRSSNNYYWACLPLLISPNRARRILNHYSHLRSKTLEELGRLLIKKNQTIFYTSIGDVLAIIMDNEDAATYNKSLRLNHLHKVLCDISKRDDD